MTTILPDAAGVILLSEDGYFLCQRRSMSKKMFPHFYEIPGGKIEEGESPAQAAVRELHEETGILIPIEKLGEVLASTKVTTEQGSYTGHVFLLRMPACYTCPRINGEPGSQWSWHSIGQMSDRIKHGESSAQMIPGAIPAIHLAAELWQKEDTERLTQLGHFERWGWSPHILFHRNKTHDMNAEKGNPWDMRFFQETSFVVGQRSFRHRPESNNMQIAGALHAPFIGTKLTIVNEFYAPPPASLHPPFRDIEVTVRIGERIAWSMPLAIMERDDRSYTYDFTKHPATASVDPARQLVSRPLRDQYISDIQTWWPLVIPDKQNLLVTLNVRHLMPHQVTASVYLHGFLAKEWA